jgi:NAD(P)H-dependent FMN reductase
MADLKIAIVVGSTRPGRKADGVARWVLEQAAGRDAADYEIVDLADFPMPLFDEELPPSFGRYAGAHTIEWAQKVADYDGFVFVTPEYNHSIPAVLKNALDYVYAEWNNKAAAFVGYGSAGGTRAIEHLRGIASELQMAHVRQTLGFSLFTDFQNFSTFTPGPQHEGAAVTLFEQLETWTTAMKAVRTGELVAA